MNPTKRDYIADQTSDYGVHYVFRQRTPVPLDNAELTEEIIDLKARVDKLERTSELFNFGSPINLNCKNE